VTDGFVDTTGTLVPNVRVFAYAFGEDPLIPFEIDDPGFNALDNVQRTASGQSDRFSDLR
jgi:hypothetical protein